MKAGFKRAAQRTRQIVLAVCASPFFVRRRGAPADKTP